MTEPIVCRDGKCKYKKRQFLDECIDCDVVEQIEHELLKKELKNNQDRGVNYGNNKNKSKSS